MTHKVNLFLIGGPKCGSTSLAAWLNQHPDIFFPEVKEPNFFNSDHVNQHTKTMEEYDKFYKKMGNIKILGDASVRYSSSDYAIKNIIRYNKNAKFVVVVRNPIDMAQSLYYQNKYTRLEKAVTFSSAWCNFKRTESSGAKFKSEFLNYGKVCSMGKQVERLYDLAPKENIKVLMLSDLAKAPGHEVRKIFEMLDIRSDVDITYESENKAKTSRFPLLWSFIILLNKIRKHLGFSSTGIGTRFDRLARQELVKEPIDDGTMYEMKRYFEEDVKLLSRLIDRDLADWLEVQ